jgi:hypothetical protein
MRGQAAEVVPGQRERAVIVDDLRREVEFGEKVKSGAENFITLNDFIQSRREYVLVEVAFQPDGTLRAEGPALPFLLQRPEACLLWGKSESLDLVLLHG